MVILDTRRDRNRGFDFYSVATPAAVKVLKQLKESWQRIC